jgi:uncharacterized membrane protein (DUF485 family)
LNIFQNFLENFLHLVAVMVLLICYNATLWTDTISPAAAKICLVLSFSYIVIVIVLIGKTKLYLIQKIFNRQNNNL